MCVCVCVRVRAGVCVCIGYVTVKRFFKSLLHISTTFGYKFSTSFVEEHYFIRQLALLLFHVGRQTATHHCSRLFGAGIQVV